MTFGMFCAIPLPKFFWDESCADLMMPCFPVVGLIIGAVWWGAAELLAYISIHVMLAAAALTVITLFAAGLIHLDGFMDTCDAVLSRRPLEDKVRILKDSHTGSFAVIMLVGLFVVQFASIFTLLDARGVLTAANGSLMGARSALAAANGSLLDTHGSFAPLLLLPVVSRCCSAISMMCLKPAPHSGYANMFRKKTGGFRIAFVCVLAAFAVGAMYLLVGWGGVIAAAAELVGYALTIAGMCRTFKGVSGDLAGFSLVVGELCGIIALAVV